MYERGPVTFASNSWFSRSCNVYLACDGHSHRSFTRSTFSLKKTAPTGLQNFLETIVSALEDFVVDIMGPKKTFGFLKNLGYFNKIEINRVEKGDINATT